jgi:type I restriction enzyme M protein
MANSASDARGTELEIRKRLIDAKAADVVVSIGPNMFYTVTLPCTLWFFDKGKRNTSREDTVLFLDARRLFRQISRAQRKFSPKQVEFLANIVRLYRGETPEFVAQNDEEYPGDEPNLKEVFPKLKYRDVLGLCKVVTNSEIGAQGWSLNPGRYVGVKPGAEVSDEEFKAQVEALHEELERLNAEAQDLEACVATNMAELLS